MLPTASDPARIGALKVMPEAIPESFVISMLPPPAPSSRQRTAAAPIGAERRTPRSGPPPLPDAAEAPAVPLRTPTLAWDIPAQANSSAAAEEDARMVRALRGSQRWGNAVQWLRLKGQAAAALATHSMRRIRISKRVAIGLSVLMAALLVWGIAKKPWAHRHAVASASSKASAHTQARAHPAKATVNAAARRPEAKPHAKPVEARSAHAHAAAKAQPVVAHSLHAAKPVAKGHSKAPAHAHATLHHPSKSAQHSAAKKPVNHGALQR